MGVVSYGSECPSHGVYGRVTEVKHWIQFLAQGAEDTNCNTDIIPEQQGKGTYKKKCGIFHTFFDGFPKVGFRILHIISCIFNEPIRHGDHRDCMY